MSKQTKLLEIDPRTTKVTLECLGCGTMTINFVFAGLLLYPQYCEKCLPKFYEGMGNPK